MNSSKLTKIEQSIPGLYLTWILNNICTNKCAYCPPIVHSGKNHHYDWNAAKTFSQHLINTYPKIHLAISGGEPTLSPFFLELIDMFYSAGNPVGITSNAARTVEYHGKMAKKLSYIVMSYHPSFEDPEFLQKALAASEFTQVTVHVMMDSRHFDLAVKKYQEFSQYDTLAVEVVRIHDWIPDTIGNQYTQEQISIIESLPTVHARSKNHPTIPGILRAKFHYENGEVVTTGSAQQFINEGNNKFLNWRCNIGIESLLVQYNGDIRRGNCTVGDPLIIGNVNDFSNINWPTEPVICTQLDCICPTDIFVSKEKI